MRRWLPLLLLLLAVGAVVFVAYEPLRDVFFPSSTDGEDGFGDELAEAGDAEGDGERDPEDGEGRTGPRLLLAERSRVDPAEIAAREAARAAAKAAADAQARAALQVDWSGALLDAAGRPVAGARIVLANDLESVTLTTREDGTFSGALVPGRYDVLITAPGRGSLFLEGYVVDGVARLDLSLALAPPLTLGFTLEQEGRGVEGARAVLALTRWRWVGKEALYGGVTDAQGRVSFPELSAGTYELRVTVPQGPDMVQTFELKQDLEARASVPAGVELTGVVTDARTQAAVPGALLRIVSAAKGGPAYVTALVAEADGSFRGSIPRGTLRELQVKAQGYAPWPGPKEFERAASRFKGLGAGKEPIVLPVPLQAGGSVAGLVTQLETRAPLPGIALLFREKGLGHTTRAESDEQGRYAVGHLNPGRYQVTVETPGWFPAQPLEINLPTGRAEPVAFDVPLQGSLVLHGVVVMPQGAPVKGARVWLTGGGKLVRSARGAGRPLETFSGASGAWTLSDVPPQLVVGVRAQLGALEAVPVFADMRKPLPAPLRLVLGGTVVLTGRVVDQGDGEPVANARVQLSPKGPPWGRDAPSATTDAQGAFRFEGLIPGDVELTPRRGDYLPVPPRALTLSADNPDVRVDLALDPGLVLAGSVSDASGRAVAGNVTASGLPDGRTENMRRGQPLGADGRFRLTGFPPGTYRLRVNAPGFKGQTLENLRGGENRLRFVLVPVPPPGS